MRRIAHNGKRMRRMLRLPGGETAVHLRRRGLAALALAVVAATPVLFNAASSSAAPVGQGFTVTPSDLSHILRQIKIAEHHVAATPAVLAAGGGICDALVGNGPDQISSPLVADGLRTVDGSCNNLVKGNEKFGAEGQTFPRLATPLFRGAEGRPVDFFGPGDPGSASSSYTQKKGSVFDTQPRLISNLIVDQTSTNPAAVQAAGHPVRTQGNPGLEVCTTDPDPTVDPPVVGVPLGCVPQHKTLFIPNVTTDVGLSPPFNGLFTIFGQFFDHGVDKTAKGGSGTVFVPLRADDPLITLGPDGKAGTGDEVPPGQRFMAVTRATNQPGPDGILGDPDPAPPDTSLDDVQDANNTDTPFVDQSQTYTSHPAHQVFLREYVMGPGPDGVLGDPDPAAPDTSLDDRPLATGKLINRTGADTGQGNWREVKQQAASLLGLQLTDQDVTNIPMVAADFYGNFIPGPNGFPQWVRQDGTTVEGNPASPVPAPANVKHFQTAFLDDIAHTAAPTGKTADGNTAIGGPQDPGTYDDELLDEHFLGGDGRLNENIALTAVHQIFHSEHDRLVNEIEDKFQNDPAYAGVAAAYHAAHPVDLDANPATPNVDISFEYGERLFQAARFVTEMEYQHLVFEEFARKVQPLINPFAGFAFTQADINPAVKAEFAHAVYRFGHSMLTETIDRTNANGTSNPISLLDGFLNPVEYHAGGLDSAQAGGAILMGMSDQTGNEIDEFVTDTLRNNLLGLPLDLPAINMARARSEGVPPLNVFRKEMYAKTNDSQLKPYTDWVDFGLHLKHPESLVNFVAAYGKHPSIVSETTIAGKRAAAKLIVDPLPTDTVPADAGDFMNSLGAWANDASGSITGLDEVDMWVGGLAERTNLFGGLLGSTFNFVFESQLTDLQNSDRLYYLGRTPGMNLRSQLEGNSFAELVMRNTNAHTLKADAFATADCKFQLASNPGIAGPINGNLVTDDPNSECDEHALLIRMADGTIRYRTTNTVDPPGINGQSVYNGTAGADKIFGGVDNDTFLGNEGDDVIEGSDGADVALGGDGNDRITDNAGDDVLKGGPGNDAIEAGPGLDIIMGGEGKDFMNGGANINEIFAGPGDDFLILGQGEDAAQGDGGDDWMEGGDQPDLLQGDSGTLFFTDRNTPGHDVMIGQAGDDDYDAEGGDDIMIADPGIEKSAGAAGYDWYIGARDPVAQNADLNLKILPPAQTAIEVRDRFNEVEALSGGKLNDTLRGDDVIPSQTGGGGFIGCDAIDAASVGRISGLDKVVTPAMLTVDPAPIIANSTSHECNLAGNVWGEGNILLGGAGSDVMEGRGGDDVIDGDRYLDVRLSVRNPANPATEIGSADLMEHQYKRDAGGALTGATLQADVMAGNVNPGNIEIAREILTPAANAADVDTAVFSEPLANYDIDTSNLAAGNADPRIIVTHARGTATDGTDTLRNVEALQFSDQTIRVGLPAAPTIGTATAGNAQATVNWIGPGTTFPAITGSRISVRVGAAVVRTVTAPAGATSAVITGLTNGTTYTFTVAAVNAIGTGPESAPSNAVTPNLPPPTVTGQNPANGAAGVAVGSNIFASFSQNVQGVSTGAASTNVKLTQTSTGVIFNSVVTYIQIPAINLRLLTINPTGNLLPGTSYTVTLTGGSCAAPASGIRTLAAPCVALATTIWSFTTAGIAPAAVVPAGTTGGGPVALALTGATVPRALTTAAVASRGLPVTFTAPATTRLVRVTIFKAGSKRVLARTFVRVNPGKHRINLRQLVVRRALHTRGRFRVELTPAVSKTELGRTSVRWIRIGR